MLSLKRVWKTQKSRALNPFFFKFQSLCLLKLNLNLPSVNLFQQITPKVTSRQERGLSLALAVLQ